MMGETPGPFRLALAKAPNGDCPFKDFLQSETDRKVQARIAAKIEYLSKLDPEDYRRPLIDTLDGPVKEMRFGPKKQLRLLFSCERGERLLLLYGGERKTTSAVSGGLIQEAKDLRQAWLKGTKAILWDPLRPQIKRKKTR